MILLGAFPGVVLMRSDEFDGVSIGCILTGYAHVGFMVWTFAELACTEIGRPVVSADWGVYALIVVTVAWGRSRLVRIVGLGTLLLTVAKIFIIDLENASGGATILLLLGFGLALLALGYLMPSDASDDELGDTPEARLSEPVGPRA